MTPLTRTGALAVVFGTASVLALGPAGPALAQAAEPRTVHALLEGDGSVDEATVVGGEGEAGELPVSLLISQAADGSEHTYEVENTTVQKQTLNYLGADGQPATVEQDVALPLVGQLSVMLPASRTDVVAPGARLTQLADGSTELVWSLVLFGPIGSPEQEVSFTSVGDGEPVARLDVAAVQPSSTQGLSATAQAANATVNGNGILGTVATGASDGLTQLSAGVGELIAGLDKLYAGAQELNEGIAAGADGAAQLAAGSAEAKKGSGELSAGLGQLAAGNGSAADGAATLSAGLAQISGGLDQLSAAQGLPAALDGAKRLQVGVDALRAGMGAPDQPETILGGLAAVQAGLGSVKGGLDGLAAGLPAAKGGVDQVAAGLGAADGALDKLSALMAGLRAAIPGCAPGLPVAAPANGCEIANTAAFIVSHPAGALGATDSGGLKQGLAAAGGGLDQVSDGLAAAIGGAAALATGTGQLQAGVTELQGGATQVAFGLESGDPAAPGVAEGLDALVSGLTAAVGGVGQLATGAKAASTGGADLASGTRQLADGATKAATGGKALDAGLAKIADGQQQVADGLPAAVDGSGQIADGLGAVLDGQRAVGKGLGDVKAQAVEVLQSQFSQGTELARQQLAGLDAASARIASDENGTTTWVFTQSRTGLDAELVSAESNMGRNAAIGVGGALLLMTGIAGGYISGRRKVVA